MTAGLPRSFAIVANGFADGPAQALRDYLVARGSRVVTVLHPLTPEQGDRHVITRYAGGQRQHERVVRGFLRPPLSFVLDPFVPPLLPPVDVWFGFNPLACARGLLARCHGFARRVVLWSVDFVPDRFGPRNPATWLYDSLDRLSCLRADARVELSQAAREARDRRHGLTPGGVPVHIVPMGAWLERVPVVPVDGYLRRRVVFLGHLVPRQGVGVLLEAVAILKASGRGVTADIIGTGTLESDLRRRAHALGLTEVVHFHGFVPDHQKVEELLAGGAVAVAPYRPGSGSFTAYADPGKLKAYLAAGLPILLTDVPPNAGELSREAGAELVPFDPSSLAEAIARLLRSPSEWRVRREAALRYAARFDWAVLLRDLLRQLGVAVEASA